ncbi:hypothetical protein EV714DRAFT_278394 [Schizophyllum commune]
MPADLASDDDPDCMAVALPHPYAPRRPKATAEAQDRHLLTSSPSHSLSPPPPDHQASRDVVLGGRDLSATRKPPEACAGILGRLGRKSKTPGTWPQILKTSSGRCSPASRFSGSLRAVHHQVLEVPSAPPDALDEPGRSLGIAEGLYEVPGVIEVSASVAIFCDPRAAGGMRGVPRVIDATSVLEVPKAPSEAPERDRGFLGIVERLPQILGVFEPFCATPEPPEASAGALGGHSRGEARAPLAAAKRREYGDSTLRLRIPLHAAPPHDPRRGETMPVRREDLTLMFIISKNASSPHSTPLDDGLRAMRHPLPLRLTALPINQSLNPAISQQEVVYVPLPRPGIDEEALDFEGGGVGGFSTLITRQYYYSQRRAPLGAK